MARPDNDIFNRHGFVGETDKKVTRDINAHTEAFLASGGVIEDCGSYNDDNIVTMVDSNGWFNWGEE